MLQVNSSVSDEILGEMEEIIRLVMSTVQQWQTTDKQALYFPTATRLLH